MKRVTEKRYEIFFREFEGLGVVIEDLLNKIQSLDYGKYNIEDLEIEAKIALKIIEGMDDFQREHNKGLRFDRIFKDTVIEIYDINEAQRKMDEMILKLNL